MRTEIVIPFAFDTAPLEAKLASDGYELILDRLTKECHEGMLRDLPKKSSGSYYGGSAKTLNEVDWSRFFRDQFTTWMNSCMDDVVDEAALVLAAKAGRKKAWREVLAEVKGETDG